MLTVVATFWFVNRTPAYRARTRRGQTRRRVGAKSHHRRARDQAATRRARASPTPTKSATASDRGTERTHDQISARSRRQRPIMRRPSIPNQDGHSRQGPRTPPFASSPTPQSASRPQRQPAISQAVTPPSAPVAAAPTPPATDERVHAFVDAIEVERHSAVRAPTAGADE